MLALEDGYERHKQRVEDCHSDYNISHKYGTDSLERKIQPILVKV